MNTLPIKDSSVSAFAYVPNDMLRHIFRGGSSEDLISLKDLVLWSLVNQQFHVCIDLSLWNEFASRHPLTQDLDLQRLDILDIKRWIFDVVRKKLIPSDGSALNFFYQPQKWLIKKTTPLSHSKRPNESRLNESCGIKLPLTINNKIFSTNNRSSTDTSVNCAELKISESGTQKMFSLRYPISNSLPTFLNTDVFICYSIPLSPSFMNKPNVCACDLASDNVCGPYSHVMQVQILSEDLHSFETLKFIVDPKDTKVELKKGCFKIIQKENETLINYSVIPILKTLESLKRLEKHSLHNPSNQICVLREFIPENAKIPSKFICQITGQIMMDPVRDSCSGSDGGHIFEREGILAFLSKGKPSKIDQKLELGKTTFALCPFTNIKMPGLERRSYHQEKIIEQETVLVDGNNVALPTQNYVLDYKVNSENTLVPDKDLQAQILEWLKKEVFEIQFQNFSETRKAAIYEALYWIQGIRPSYYGIGEDAFHGRKKQSSTTYEKISALFYVLCRKAGAGTYSRDHLFCSGSENSKTSSFEEHFSLVPDSSKSEIYKHLYEIQKPSNSYWGIGEDAFHDRNGQSSTIAEKLEALRRHLHEAEIEALDCF